MFNLLSGGWLEVAVPLATALLCLGSALGIFGAILLNRGAKVNLSWAFIAFGLLAIAVAEGDRVAAALGWPNLTGLRDVVKLCGALLCFCGVLYGRDILRRLVK